MALALVASAACAPGPAAAPLAPLARTTTSKATATTSATSTSNPPTVTSNPPIPASSSSHEDVSPPAGQNAHLDDIRACESNHDYQAVSAGGQYRGAYQFSRETWRSVGGTGDPAAASEGEQDRRAAMLYEREGAAPWPNCGR